MTTNQTIDGVPRELLPCPLCGSDKVSLAWDVYDTDRGRRTQSQIQCLGCRILTKTFKSHAEARAYWNNRAVQPQGEPVAWMYRRSKGGECLGQLVQMESDNLKDMRQGKVVEGRRILWPRDDYTDWKPLYAEQPAPASVALPVDPERERLMEIVQQYPNVDPLKYDAAVRTLRK